VIAVLTFSVMPATTYTYVVRELSQTMTGQFTFGGNAVIPAAQKLYIGATGSNNYIQGDDSTQFVKVYINGVVKATVTQNGVIPGACPSDVYAIENGTECFNSSTGVKWRRDFKGVHEVLN
jgi:hypothetical protein